MRKSLFNSLSQNSRNRHFVIDATLVANFETDIVRFIKSFVERYSFKYLHDQPPLFAFLGVVDVDAVQVRLHDLGIRCQTGRVGTMLKSAELFRAPIIKGKPVVQMEFRVRLAHRSELSGITAPQPDDLFLVNVVDDMWAHPDINVHRLGIDRLSDLEYVTHLRSDCG